MTQSEPPELAEAKALLSDARRQVWNDWYDLPGRGHALFVARVDRFLGQPSKWADRYVAQGYDDRENAALNEALELAR